MESGSIDISNGNKFKQEADLALPSSLSFQRFYNSNAQVVPATLGANWRHSFDRALEVLTTAPGYSGASLINASRPDGRRERFVKTNGVWTAEPGSPNLLTEQSDANGVLQSYTVFMARSRESERYSADGLLTAMTDETGASTTFAYSTASTPPATAPRPGLLLTASDARGRAIEFTYDGTGRISTVTGPDGNALAYGYSNNNLVSVQYPGAVTRQYLYNEPSLTGNTDLPAALTGILDETSARIESTGYDSTYRAVSSKRGTDADAATYQYNTNGTTGVQAALGAQTTVGFSNVQGDLKVASSSTSCGMQCNQPWTSRTYDANGYPVLTRDFNDTVTATTYDATGLLTQGIEAQGTPAQRTTDTTWDAALRVPLERSVLDAADNVVALEKWHYNSRGQATAHCRIEPSIPGAASYACGSQGAAPQGVRQAQTVYCEQADITAGTCPLLGLVTSVDGPRTDVADVTTYAYYPSDATTCANAPATCPHRKGDLWKVTNALGHVVEAVSYDASGRATSIKDLNGVVTDLEYTPRGWLTATKVRGTTDTAETDDRITRLEYWPTGLVKRVTDPTGAAPGFIYDSAQRLTDIVDNAGNTIHYTLDAAGNRRQEDTKAADDTVKRTLSRIYNQLGQLATQADASSNPTDFTYDANGNLATVTDALDRVGDNTYDPLDRLEHTLQDVGGIEAGTAFEYDALDHPVKVTDPKGLDTTYAYNGLGDLTQQTSPDTGITSFTYDSAGNLASRLDANRSEPLTYAYDALNRLTSISYSLAGGGQDVTYAYDSAPAACATGETFAQGRLSTMTDRSGHTDYCYYRFGDLVRKEQTSYGQVFTLRYAYTKAGQLAKLTYPDGAEVDYVRDAQGRTTAIGVKPAGGVREVLLDQATYAPFGPNIGWEYGNGRSLLRSVDADYRPETVLDGAAGGLSTSYGFDAVGNLTELQDGLQVTPLAQYAYDALGRLTTTKDGATGTPIETYGYDATGNRTSLTTSAGTATYSYAATNHRLANIAGLARSYDAAGNTVSIGGTAKQYVYDEANRLGWVKQGGVAVRQYLYNGRGERVVSQLPGVPSDDPSGDGEDIPPVSTHTVYDEAGHWLGDYDDSGNTLQQAIWLDDLPVGLLAGAGSAQRLHYVEPDHLGTPRVVIDPVRDVAVWKWDAKSEAFGNSSPTQDPDLDGTNFVLDMRFPGQRYDSASGLNYNYFRDYEAATGRYPQSDPIGLMGGVSTYGYVEGNPIANSDPIGLCLFCVFARPPVMLRPAVPGEVLPRVPLRMAPRPNPLSQAIRQTLSRPEPRFCPRPTPVEQALTDLGIKPRGPMTPEIRQPLPLPTPPAPREGITGLLADMLDALFGSGGGAGSVVLPAGVNPAESSPATGDPLDQCAANPECV